MHEVNGVPGTDTETEQYSIEPRIRITKEI